MGSVSFTRIGECVGSSLANGCNCSRWRSRGAGAYCSWTCDRPAAGVGLRFVRGEDAFAVGDAEQEHAVKEKHRVRGGRRHQRGQGGVRVEVVDRVLVAPVAVRAQRVEQGPAERVVVEGIAVVGFGRELAAPVALGPGQVELSAEARMTSRPRVRRSRANSSASVVLPAAGGPSTATRSGCEAVTDCQSSQARGRRARFCRLCGSAIRTPGTAGPGPGWPPSRRRSRAARPRPRPGRAAVRGYAGLRATPPHRAAAAADSSSVCGLHLESWTTPGSTRSRPSKKLVTWARSRSTSGAASCRSLSASAQSASSG